MTHDDVCPTKTLPAANCLICRAVTAARSQERATFADTWQVNLPLVTADARKDERATIENRIRESGIARHLSSHEWDRLVACVRGTIRP